MNDCAFVCPLGYGDLILFSGAAVCYLQKFDNVYFPCKESQLESVNALFAEQPRIKPYALTKKTPEGFLEFPKEYLEDKTIVSTFGGIPPRPFDNTISFAENYYKFLGLEYWVSWDFCPLPVAIEPHLDQDVDLPHPYCFVHDDASRGFNIDEKLLPEGYTIIRPPGRNISTDSNSVIDTKGIIRPPDHTGFSWLHEGGFSNILKYATLLMYADEIHVMDSMFLHYAERIQTFGKLFYHEYVRPFSMRRVPSEPMCPMRKKWTVYPQPDFINL